MSFRTKNCYGERCDYDENADLPEVVDRLLAELEEEQFDEEIAVIHGQWSLMVTLWRDPVRSFMSWIIGKDHDGSPIPALYKVIESREDVLELLENMARGEISALRQELWVPWNELPHRKRQLAEIDQQQEAELDRQHLETAMPFATRLLAAQMAASNRLRVDEPDLSSVVEASQVIATLEGGRLKYAFLQVPETSDCEERTLAFDWKMIAEMTDSELVAELIQFVRLRGTGVDFSELPDDGA